MSVADDHLTRYSGECACGEEVAIHADHERTSARCVRCFRRVRMSADD